MRVGRDCLDDQRWGELVSKGEESLDGKEKKVSGWETEARVWTGNRRKGLDGKGGESLYGKKKKESGSTWGSTGPFILGMGTCLLHDGMRGEVQPPVRETFHRFGLRLWRRRTPAAQRPVPKLPCVKPRVWRATK